SANASVESLMDGVDFKSSINRIRFDMLSRKVFQEIANFALDAVKKASLEPIDIDEVCSLKLILIQILLVGGTCSLPKLSSVLQSTFPQPTVVLPMTYNPSELVSRGAAIQSSLISAYDPQTISEAIHPVVTLVG